jgi:thiamine transport system permease protein
LSFFSELLAPETLHALWLTLRFATLALFFSWVLSLCFLYFKSRRTFSLFRLLWVLPGFGYALITLSALRFLGVEHRYSMFSVLLAWILAGTPYLSLAFQTLIRDLDFREKEVLSTLGASPVRAFYEFEFKRTLPGQAFALLQQFWLYLTSFSLVMILSGGFPNETLEVAIYTSVRLDHVDMNRAYALGLWQFLLLVPIRIFLNRLGKSARATEWTTRSTPRSFSSLPSLLALVSFLAILLYAKTSSLETSGLFPSLGTSFILSTSVSILTLAWTLGLYYFGFGWIAEIGAWVSPMLLTLLWWKGFGFTLLPLVNSLLVQVLLFSPWMARSLFPLLKRMRMAELEAARSLGCSPRHAWFAVEWPRIRRGVYFTVSLVLALSLTEVTAVLLFSQNGFEPLSVWVQNAFMRFRMDEAILGTLLLVSMSYLGLSLGREES